MTPNDFCRWLDGFLSAERDNKNLPKKEVDIIKEKLASVLQVRFITPDKIQPWFEPCHDGIQYPIPYNGGIPYSNGVASDFATISCGNHSPGSG